MQQGSATESGTRAVTTSRSGQRLPRRSRPTQHEFFTRTWGGPRRGAGRKPKGERPLVSHAGRAALDPGHPVHVTTRLQPGLPSLRKSEELRTVMRAIRDAQERSGMRIVHYSVQSNHLHLLVEAQGRESLSLGIQGLLVRIARALNRLWQRAGRLFADRYHAHALKHPAEVRRALLYVLHNARKHGLPITGVDAYSSGAWFDGWNESTGLAERVAEIRRRLVNLLEGRDPRLERGRLRARPKGPQAGTGLLARARTWLLARGWRRHGEIRANETPGRSGAAGRVCARGRETRA